MAGFLLLRAASLLESWLLMGLAVGLLLMGMIRAFGQKAHLKRH